MRFGKLGVFVFGLLIGCVVLVEVGALATTAKKFLTKTKGDFDGCELRGVTLTDQGKIILSAQLEKVAELGESHIWAIAADRSKTLFACTGDEGRIFVIKPGGKPKVLYDSDEKEIESVLIDRLGRLVVGTGPGGLVLAIDPATGEVTTLLETGEKYVWSLALGPKGKIFAGTGPAGVVFEIAGDGKSKKILETPGPNVTALVYDKASARLLVGTSSGVVYSLGQSGHTEALLEAKGMEIRSIVVDGQELFVLAMAGSGNPGPGGSLAEAMKAAFEAAAAKEEKPKPSKVGKVKSAVYKVFKDGHSEQIFRSEKGSLFAMLRYGERLLLFGYREAEGVVVSMTKDGEADLLRSIEDAKFISACRIPQEGFALGTAESARLFKLWPGRMPLSGSVISKVKDARVPARWGKLTWQAKLPSGTKIRLFTRSGNVSTVDESWSKWQGPLVNSKGSQCKSPGARYIQWKAVLIRSKAAGSPALDEVVVPYEQINVAPKVKSITVHKPGKSVSSIIRSAKTKTTSAKYRKLKQLERFSEMEERKTLRAVTWSASDVNGDSLVYQVQLRSKGGGWRTLVEETPLTFYVLDTVLLPDGEYQVRVKACDSPDNPQGQALSADKKSGWFLVDNTPPAIKIGRANRIGERSYRITGVIRDTTSVISQAYFAIDLGPFQVLQPTDGILDSKQERFAITTPKLTGPNHFITIRAIDAAGNEAVARRKL